MRNYARIGCDGTYYGIILLYELGDLIHELPFQKGDT
jgi:hypothetical protein